MSRTSIGPADTQLMGIVHSALRRDLVRTRIVVGATPDGARRVAVAEHVLWMMDFLRHHHAGEDTGLFPLVVRENPAAADLVAGMDHEHERIAPAITNLETAARSYGEGSPGSEAALLDTLAELSTALLPHLRREEVEMMPVVSASITAGQWSAWDQEVNVKPKGLTQLGFEGHWLIDGLDDEGRRCVVGLVPPIPRFILLRGFAGRYARRKAALWRGTDAWDVPSLSVTHSDSDSG